MGIWVDFRDIINGAYSVTVTKQDKTKARDEYNKILTIERQLVENCCTNKEEMGKYGEKLFERMKFSKKFHKHTHFIFQKGGVESKTSERVVENPTTVLVQRECEDDKDTFEGSEDQNTIIIQLFIPSIVYSYMVYCTGLMGQCSLAAMNCSLGQFAINQSFFKVSSDNVERENDSSNDEYYQENNLQ
ncbi:Uncharacterized protein APZ42_032047 [Daphnia magna]|uniref:Uncharacterized protein n=1 Tax=Daphnia magna TaxID=35525 RepID=A0A164MC79_9CRUS|nr:Uncharacterized protein APZ42_032047 [Daphnia magna]